MTSGARTVVVVVVLIAFGIGLLLWKEREAKIAIPPSTPEVPLPAYLLEKPQVFITKPLIFQDGSSPLTLEQKREIADFRRLILSRVTSGAPLTESERIIIAGSMSAASEADEAGITVVDQRLLQFTKAELELISNALKQ